MGTGGHQGWRDDAKDGEGREDGGQIAGMGGVERSGSEAEPLNFAGENRDVFTCWSQLYHSLLRLADLRFLKLCSAPKFGARLFLSPASDSTPTVAGRESHS